MDANLYLFLAYTFIWVGVGGFLWFLDRRTRQLRQEITLLQERLSDEISKGDH